MININNVSYKYKNRDEVLKNINLEIKEGEFVVVVGKNGSGKSTFGKLASGLIVPKTGEVLIDNISTFSKKDELEIRKKVGIVFQNPENQLVFNSIEDEFSFTLKNLEKEDELVNIDEVLKQVGMETHKSEDIYELSMGQKQRVAIAEVLSFKPKYIVFDEPTTMLDTKGKEDVYNIVGELKDKGYTIIYITNVADEILLADTIVILDNGELVKKIEKKDLMRKYRFA